MVAGFVGDPTINELKSLFDDIKNRNYSSSFDTFSLSFSLGFFKGMYSYDLCYFIVTKDGKIGTVSVNSNTFKLNENSFVALNDPDDRCPPTLLWRIIE